ncbi:hypothetical protein KR059_009557, partial [Drosophila kikkawai]
LLINYIFIYFLGHKFGYVVSQKGRVQLIHRNFSYVREKCINNKTYWRCTQYTTQIKCHGRVHTLQGRIVHSSSHNHQPCGQGRRQSINIISVE